MERVSERADSEATYSELRRWISKAGVWGLGFRVGGLGFRVGGLGFRVGGFRVGGLGFRVLGFGLGLRALFRV